MGLVMIGLRDASLTWCNGTLMGSRGSFLLSRLANYFPDRFLKFAWLDVAYQAPVGLFDVGALNALSEKMMGYPAFSYWDFFTDEDTADLMDRNVR